MNRINLTRIRVITWFYRIMGTLLLPSIPTLRKAAGQGGPVIHLPEGIERQCITVHDIPCEWLIPVSSNESGVVLYIHAGGGVVGLLDSERRMIARISKACQLRSILPDYRLAPEHPFPAGLEDCVTVYNWLISNGFPSDKIAVVGCSAGGLLTITLLLAILKANLPLPATAVCLSPNTDPSCSGASIRKNRFRDALLSPKYLRKMMQLYSGEHDLRDPLLTPLYADLHSLPPLLIQVGEDELLLDDAIRFADCAKAAGVPLELEIWPNMWHAWQTTTQDLPETKQALEHIVNYLGVGLEIQGSSSAS